jgi:hypothetical protein
MLDSATGNPSATAGRPAYTIRRSSIHSNRTWWRLFRAWLRLSEVLVFVAFIDTTDGGARDGNSAPDRAARSAECVDNYEVAVIVAVTLPLLVLL